MFLSVSDWIALKFGGRAGTDYCGASTTGLYDNERQAWIGEVCEHFGIPESLLPVVEPSDAVIGAVVERASSETGIPAGAMIVRQSRGSDLHGMPFGGRPHHLTWNKRRADVFI